MLEVLWLVPLWPLLGFAILALARGPVDRDAVAAIGVGSVGLSAVTAFVVAIGFFTTPLPGGAYTQVLWQWMAVTSFAPRVAFYLDALSLVMVLTVTFVSLAIHLYSVEYMEADEDLSRFFAYMNLFVASMLTLVLADNLLLLYLGWEGVGLCSYLLIGFWYRNPVNGAAAQKAFIVTRVGDTAMAIGLFLLFTWLGTLEIQPLLATATRTWAVGAAPAVAAAALLLGGAVGKSAQLPLQTWLPDAMAGPTPVSALIHAATMVTAGVYLIARTHTLFELAPAVQWVVAVVGAATLLLSGFSALAQRDIKRVLAYSTISQIGYMFLALGVGAWAASIFHLVTHAFFKALLFLAAGAIAHSLPHGWDERAQVYHEYDLFRMGGLRRELPLVFWTFLIGAGALAGFPLITAGFYSKGLILWRTWISPHGGVGLWIAGWAGTLLTSIYIFRVVFVAFFGEVRTPVTHRPRLPIALALVVLAVFAVGVGWMELPAFLGDRPAFTNFLQHALPAPGERPVTGASELGLELVLVATVLGGILVAYLLFRRSPGLVAAVARARPGALVRALWARGWGFDFLYETLLVRPYAWVAAVDRDDIVDAVYGGLATLTAAVNRALTPTESGLVRRYAVGVVVGAVVVIALVTLR